MKKTGLVGWRGMVGSVLMERMRAENDFEHIEPIFFYSSHCHSSHLLLFNILAIYC